MAWGGGFDDGTDADAFRNTHLGTESSRARVSVGNAFEPFQIVREETIADEVNSSL